MRTIHSSITFSLSALINRRPTITVQNRKEKGKDIRDFAFQWDSDIEDLCTQNYRAKCGIPREKLS